MKPWRWVTTPNPSQGQKSKLTPELTAQLLKHAKTQIRAINRMITDILKTARGVTLELQLHPQEMDLTKLCFEVVEFLQQRLQEKTALPDHRITQRFTHGLCRRQPD